MKSVLKISLALLVCAGANMAHAAADNPPAKDEAKEKVESGPAGGAVKVEKRHAVSEQDLKNSETTDTPGVALPSSASTQLFGLHAALGVPHPISVGLNYVVPSHLFSFELSVGSFAATVNDTKAKLTNSEVALRWHPWAGSFYLGALLGNQKIHAEKTEVINGQLANGKVDVTSNYISPHFGWAWGAQDTGFFTSIEFGYQSPSNVKTDFSTDVTNPLVLADPNYAQLRRDVLDQGDKVGNTGLPHIVLFKIGWLF